MRMIRILALLLTLPLAVACGEDEDNKGTGTGLVVIDHGGSGTTDPGTGDNPGTGGEDPGTGGEDPADEAEKAYHLWNNGGGIQPAPKGVPEGYTPKTYKNPVFGKKYMTPDPTVIRVNGYFYVFSTSGNCRILRSKDLVSWEYIGDAFTDAGRPAWLSNEDGSKVGLWAPDANIINGKYVLYYSLATNNNVRGIGRAVADKIEGPYTDMGRLIQSFTYGTTGSIDQYYFEYEGSKYLAWGNFANIYCAQLTDDGLDLKYPGDGTQKNIRKIAGKAFEGSLIHKRGEWFYYIGSVGTCCKGYDSTYHLQVARAKSPFGPFISKSGADISVGSTQGTTFLQGNSSFIGPGHNAEIITDDAGDDWLLYHCYQYGVSDSKRLLFLDKIVWDEDGWPTIAGGVPSASATAPVFAD